MVIAPSRRRSERKAIVRPLRVSPPRSFANRASMSDWITGIDGDIDDMDDVFAEL